MGYKQQDLGEFIYDAVTEIVDRLVKDYSMTEGSMGTKFFVYAQPEDRDDDFIKAEFGSEYTSLPQGTKSMKHVVDAISKTMLRRDAEVFAIIVVVEGKMRAYDGHPTFNNEELEEEAKSLADSAPMQERGVLVYGLTVDDKHSMAAIELNEDNTFAEVTIASHEEIGDHPYGLTSGKDALDNMCGYIIHEVRKSMAESRERLSQRHAKKTVFDAGEYSRDLLKERVVLPKYRLN